MALSPKELEYLAECEPIQVVPNFRLEKMYLISGDVGPFKPGIPVAVPLWMAVNLSRSSKCTIITPDWMTVDVLQGVKNAEKDDPTRFTPMPSEHYMAIGKLLFQACPGEINNCDEVKTLMKDIWDIRCAKLRVSLKLLLSEDLATATNIQVNHLTMLEMCNIRPFMNHSLEQIHRLYKSATEAAAATQRSNNTQDLSMSMASGSSQSHSQSQSQGR